MKVLLLSSDTGKAGNILHVIYPCFKENNYSFLLCAFDSLCRKIFFFTYILLINALSLRGHNQTHAWSFLCWPFRGIGIFMCLLNSILTLRVMEWGTLSCCCYMFSSLLKAIPQKPPFLVIPLEWLGLCVHTHLPFVTVGIEAVVPCHCKDSTSVLLVAGQAGEDQSSGGACVQWAAGFILDIILSWLV